MVLCNTSYNLYVFFLLVDWGRYRDQWGGIIRVGEGRDLKQAFVSPVLLSSSAVLVKLEYVMYLTIHRQL